MARKKGVAPLVSGATLEERVVAKLGPAEASLASAPLTSDIASYISTQCAVLDYAIGQPGIPLGRLTVFYGKEGSGKSTLALHVLAETQRRGGLAVLIDAEHRFTRDRGERIGLDSSRLVMPTPLTMEKCFADVEEIIDYVREEDPDRLVCIVIDSLSGLPTTKQMDATLDDAVQPASAARLVSGELPRLCGMLARHRIALIIVNQLRHHLDMDPRSKERRKVLKKDAMIAEGSLVFWGSLFVYLTSIGVLGEKTDPTGITARATIRKNSIAPEGKQAVFDIDALYGIDRLGSKLDLLERLGTITQAGPWFTYDGKKFQRKGFGEVLAEHPELEEIIAGAPLLWLEGV